MMKAGCLALAFGAALAAPAAAQQMTWTDKGFVNVNLGVQGGSDTLATASTFQLYTEDGTLSTTQDIDGGGMFDVSAGYKVWKNLAVGIGYSRVQSEGDAALAANVPDPNFFDRLRGVTGIAGGAEHAEHAFHFQGTWIMPVTDTLDVGFSFGPTIFRVSQDVPTAVTVNEPGPTIASTALTRESKMGAGINLGVDVNYFFTPRFGAGGLARFTWGSVDLDASDDSLRVGGFQIGGGLRVRF